MSKSPRPKRPAWAPRTKLIVTVGPTCADQEMIENMIVAGAGVFRLNMSHGDHETHAAYLDAVRRAQKKLDCHAAVLVDLAGPKIRTGPLADGAPVTLKAGASFTLTARRVVGDNERVSVTYGRLVKDVHEGQTILLDDGNIQLTVVDVADRDIITRVEVGGMLAEHKGVNVPDTVISGRAPTRKDLKDLDWALDAGADFIGLSFVQSADDIARLRRAMRRRGARVPVVAKIERAAAVDRLDSIIPAADVVMVARGDLGVEMPTSELPVLQKQIMALAGKWARTDITATQMLESMRHNPRPTRAEATDIANAILDGTDVIMLAGETAAGEYPLEAVKTAMEIARRTEASSFYRAAVKGTDRLPAPPEVAATVRAACAAAAEVDAKAVVVFTHSGLTAALVAQLRPACPIIAMGDSERTARRTAILWGTTPVCIPTAKSLDALFDIGNRTLRGPLGLRRGDTVIFVAGSNLCAGAANLMRAYTL